jgi:serine protease Do
MSPCASAHLRPRPTAVAIACLILGLCLGVGWPGRALGQTGLEELLSYGQAVTSQQREELRLTLAKHSQVLEAQATVVKTVAKLVGPTVVHIEADVRPQAVGLYGNRRRQVEEAGSGTIIRLKDKYYVLTNGHVVRESSPETIKINLADGRQIFPDQLRDDPATDVAVLAISAPNLVAAEVGDSSLMEIGDFVLAVGSPFGLSHSVTYGIISARGRRKLTLGEAGIDYQDFFQTDAAVNPGNSGGPLVNLRGEIIGINTAIASNSGGSEGIAFAIPINMAMAVCRQLVERGTVTRAFLGVDLDRFFGPEMAAEIGLPRPTGARIKGVRPGTPAEAAKLQVGDVILRFNETAIEDDAHLVNLVSMTEIGQSVSLVILRERKPLTLTVKLADRSQFP